jgi:hypothetical protein
VEFEVVVVINVKVVSYITPCNFIGFNVSQGNVAAIFRVEDGVSMYNFIFPSV